MLLAALIPLFSKFLVFFGDQTPVVAERIL